MDTVFSLTAIVFAWYFWGLFSELLLAATHLKVLLCIGKPYPAQELSSKRTTYFVYDLLSPWLALAAAAAMTLPTAKLPVPALNSTVTVALLSPPAVERLTSAPAIHFPTGPTSCNSTSSSNATCSASYAAMMHHPFQQKLQKESEVQPLLYARPAPASVEELLLQGHRSQFGQGWGAFATQASAEFGTPSTLAFTGLQQLLPKALHPSTTHIAAALLLLVAGHAVMHLYYIASWHSQHSRHVIQMSASKDMASRLQRFRALEVAWFVLGTSYDILTHVVITALLLQSIWARLGNAATKL